MSEYPVLSTIRFYGKSHEEIQKSSAEKSKKFNRSTVPYIPRNLMHGPNILWKVFPKQDKALEFMKSCKDGLMCFAFEHFGPGRLFLVAHPEVFWHYDVQRDSISRSTYEIITEFTACKIYVDLEYDISLNQRSNGVRMVTVFIKLLCFYLGKIWGVVSTPEHVLNLDSTTNSKFSRHLIFNLPNYCFSNNYQVGYFIKYVCQNIRDIIESSIVPEIMAGEFSLDDFNDLMVSDAKGNSRIFCDEGVYTKNRHFRLFGSSKKGKNSNLVLSKDNTFSARSDLQIFLDSLITYINTSEIKTLEFNDLQIEKKGLPRKPTLNTVETKSPFPLVDNFISDLVVPGKIYRSVYFGTKKIIVYDIVGNRYCGNIKREHKSNNVKYVVDLTSCVYYQKCYDQDCSAFRSMKVSLPYQIAFILNDNSDICGSENNHGVFGLTPTDTIQVLDAIETIASSHSNINVLQRGPNSPTRLQRFPSFGLSDEEFAKIDC